MRRSDRDADSDHREQLHRVLQGADGARERAQAEDAAGAPSSARCEPHHGLLLRAPHAAHAAAPAVLSSSFSSSFSAGAGEHRNPDPSDRSGHCRRCPRRSGRHRRRQRASREQREWNAQFRAPLAASNADSSNADAIAAAIAISVAACVAAFFAATIAATVATAVADQLTGQHKIVTCRISNHLQYKDLHLQGSFFKTNRSL